MILIFRFYLLKGYPCLLFIPSMDDICWSQLPDPHTPGQLRISCRWSATCDIGEQEQRPNYGNVHV